MNEVWDVRGRTQGRKAEEEMCQRQNIRGIIREALNSGGKREDLSCSIEEPWGDTECFNQGIMGSRCHFFN